MPAVAKKKPNPDHHKGIALGFRADRWRLVRALDAYADHIRRSRNMAMILLLEGALEREGFPVEKFPDQPEE